MNLSTNEAGGIAGDYYGPSGDMSYSGHDLLAAMRAITSNMGRGGFAGGGGGGVAGGIGSVLGGLASGANPLAALINKFGGGGGNLAKSAMGLLGRLPQGTRTTRTGGGGGGISGSGGRYTGRDTGASGNFKVQGFAESRKPFMDAINADPNLKQRVFDIAANEQGGNARGTQGVMETLFNRTENYMQSHPGTSAADALRINARFTSEGGYYDDKQRRGHGDPNNPVYQQSLTKVGSGSDITRGATDNSSEGSTGYASGQERRGEFENRAIITGEHFQVGAKPGFGQPRNQWEHWYQARTGGQKTPDQATQTADATRVEGLQARTGPAYVGPGGGADVSEAQANRPSYEEHDIRLAWDKDHAYHYGTGAGDRDPAHPSTPYGDYPIGLNPPGDVGRRLHAVQINQNEIYDPSNRLGGGRSHMTEGILIHSGSAQSLYSQGCLAVDPAQWPELRAQIAKAETEHPGQVRLRVGPQGATIYIQGQEKEQVTVQKEAGAQTVKGPPPQYRETKTPQGYRFADNMPAEMRGYVKDGILELPVKPSTARAFDQRAAALDDALKASLSTERYNEWAATGRLDPSKMSDDEYGKLVKHSGPQGFAGMVSRNPDKIGREEIPGTAATPQAPPFDNRPALPAERQPGRGWVPPAQRQAAGSEAIRTGGMAGRGGATTGEPSFARRPTPGTDPLREIFRTDRGPKTPVDSHTFLSGYAGGVGGPYTQAGRGGATSAAQAMPYTMGGRGGATSMDQFPGVGRQTWGQWLSSKWHPGAQGAGTGEAGQLVQSGPSEPIFATMTPHTASVAAIVQQSSTATATAVTHAHVNAMKIMHPHSAGVDLQNPNNISRVAPHSVARKSATPSPAPRSVVRRPDSKDKSIPHPEKRGQPKQDNASDKANRPGTIRNPGPVVPNPQHRNSDGSAIDQTSPMPGHAGTGEQHGKDGTSICAV